MAFTCTPNLLTHGPLATAEVGGAVRTHTTSYLVEGLASDFGTDDTATMNVLHTAIVDLPMPGEAWGSGGGWNTSNMFVIGRTCRMEAPTLAFVDVSWQQFETSLNNPDGIGTTHSVGTKTVTTSSDRSGEPLTVGYQDGPPQQPSVTVMDAEPVYSTELVVDIIGDTEPTDLTNYYVGKVNSGDWRGYVANSWLCTAATPRPLNPFLQYSNLAIGYRRYVYSFRFVAATYGNGWNPTIEWIDSTTRMPPSDLVDDEGRKLVEWYEAADFSQEPQTIAGSL